MGRSLNFEQNMLFCSIVSTTTSHFSSVARARERARERERERESEGERVRKSVRARISIHRRFMYRESADDVQSNIYI